MPLRPLRLLPLLASVAVLACGRANAGAPNAAALLEDAKLYVTAPLRWDATDWGYFGGTLVAIAAAHEYDDNVRMHFADASALKDGKDTHDTRDMLPAAAIVGLTWAYATLIDSSAGYDEGRSMLEAAGFAALSTTVIKYAAGRRRPDETAQVDDWFHSGASFPSRHASITFAVGGVLAESGNDDYRWVRRVLGYGIASAVSYSRVHDDVHWLSDVVAGAALGLSTARFVANRDSARRERYSLMVAPTDGGAMLTYTLRFN
jgi:hypothetical protein